MEKEQTKDLPIELWQMVWQWGLFARAGKGGLFWLRNLRLVCAQWDRQSSAIWAQIGAIHPRCLDVKRALNDVEKTSPVPLKFQQHYDLRFPRVEHVAICSQSRRVFVILSSEGGSLKQQVIVCFDTDHEGRISWQHHHKLSRVNDTLMHDIYALNARLVLTANPDETMLWRDISEANDWSNVKRELVPARLDSSSFGTPVIWQRAYLAMISSDNNDHILCFDLQTLELKLTLTEHTGEITSLSTWDDDLISYDRDSIIRLWRPDGTCKQVIKAIGTVLDACPYFDMLWTAGLSPASAKHSVELYCRSDNGEDLVLHSTIPSVNTYSVLPWKGLFAIAYDSRVDLWTDYGKRAATYSFLRYPNVSGAIGDTLYIFERYEHHLHALTLTTS